VTRAAWSLAARRAFLAGDIERFRFCAAMAREVD
jgi:hypothetical protein